jgi:hypothetical protein
VRGRIPITVVVRVLVGGWDAKLTCGIGLRESVDPVEARLQLFEGTGPLEARRVASVVGTMCVEDVVLIDELAGRVDRGSAVACRPSDPVGDVSVDALRHGRGSFHRARTPRTAWGLTGQER